MPYRAIGSKVVDFAKSKGYGVGKKKIKHVRPSMLRIQRNMHGNGLRVAGGAISLADCHCGGRLPKRLPSYIFKFNYFHLYNTYIDEN